MELPEQRAAMEEEDANCPIVWPELGVLWPERPVKVVEQKPITLPTLLNQIGGTRVLCDWNRILLLCSDKYIWRSPLTNSQTTLHDLLLNKVWKIGVVEADSLSVRELLD